MKQSCIHFIWSKPDLNDIIWSTGNLGRALRVPEKHSSDHVPEYCQQWTGIWRKTLGSNTATPVRKACFLHGNQCADEGFNWYT